MSQSSIANEKAEQSVLGALLIRSQYLEEVAGIINPGSFYREGHGLIFRAMLDLHEQCQPVELVTVAMLLRERAQLEKAGGAQYLADLSENVGLAANAAYYARLVQTKYRLRLLKSRALEIARACDDFGCDDRVEDLYLYAESQFQDGLREVQAAALPEVVSGRELLAKDFTQVTPVIGQGLLPAGCGLIIAGESGEGKSLLALEIALHLCLGRDLWGLEIPRARRVLIVQFENTQQLDQVRLRRMLKGLKMECPENLFFSRPEAPLNLADKVDRVRLRAMINRQNPEVVIYDPLSCLHQENENDNAKMRRIMGLLTAVSKQTSTSAIVVHHYGKPGKEETDGRYRTRGASSIRDWADTLMGFSFHKNGSDLILRDLNFFKIRNGAPLKPLVLERDKETFLHRVSEGDSICSPGLVLSILLEKFAGKAEQKKLVTAIQGSVGCQETSARNFLTDAVKYGYVEKVVDPDNRRQNICRASLGFTKA